MTRHFSRYGRISWGDLQSLSTRALSTRTCRGFYGIPSFLQFNSTRCATRPSSHRRYMNSFPPIADSSDMDNRKAFGLLKLSKFTRSEIDWRFDQIVHAGWKHEVGDANVAPADNSLHYSDKPCMHQSDLETFLFQGYLRMEDQWNAKHYEEISNTENPYNEIDDATQIQLQFKEALNLHKQQQSRMKCIRECARNDAATLFQLLQPQISSDTIESRTSITKQQFFASITNLATQINYPTIVPLAASMLLVGSSVGVISPIMPFLAAKLDLTTSQYGTVVSSFALSKMLGNVPSAFLVERHGRKPYLVHSLWLVGLGVAGLGLSENWVELSACRMTIGLGVAALTTASTLTVADVSTPLSRASTYAPVMSAFAAGTALGPALGGILCDEFGIRDTFLIVAASYGVAGIWNNASLRETGQKVFSMGGTQKLSWHDDAIDVSISKAGTDKSAVSNVTIMVKQALKETAEQWSDLVKDQNVRPIIIMNSFYMMAFSGSQMTLLPLLLTSGGPNSAATGLALTATTMGYVFMWMSAVTVLGNIPSARFADKAGKSNAIIAGGVLTSAAMLTVPVLCAYGDYVALDPNNVNWPILAGMLGVWSLGGTLLSTSHVAAISDAVCDTRRSQAIALLRTAGDVGYLCGALGAGLAADFVGDVGFAMQALSGLLMGATGWFAVQTLALNRLEHINKNETK